MEQRAASRVSSEIVAVRRLLDELFALEALVRFSDEEFRYQTLFQRVEALAAQSRPGRGP